MRRKRLNFLLLVPVLVLVSMADACDDHQPSSDQIQQQQQEQILQEGTSAVGMPSIKNFREKRLLKQILELRDRTDLTTYTYTYS